MAWVQSLIRELRSCKPSCEPKKKKVFLHLRHDFVVQNITAAAKSLQSCPTMCDAMRPHRQQPTRLPRPWDSQGKNIGVGCHFLLQCVKVEIESEVAQSCPTLSDPVDCSLLGSSVHGILQARALQWGAYHLHASLFASGSS